MQMEGERAVGDSDSDYASLQHGAQGKDKG